ncbi:MAG: flagellar export chaperone FliS [Phycisphaerae bacterium]|jgi:flagellar protein FliS
MKGIETYRETAVTTQSKGQLVVMLYDGAIKFLKQAINEIEAGNTEAKGKYISKAIDILFELNTVLDMEAGGEIATNLRSLYMFMGRDLTEANIKQDTGKIKEVIKLLEELNQSWKTIVS